VALKKFAHGDYLLYQNKNKEALTQFQTILKENKGDEIVSITLYRMAKIYEKLGDFENALAQYQAIIDQHQDGIYIDEALYFSAEIQNKQRSDVDKAKALYEQIIFHHEDSIYFIDARKKYRQLRGDKEI
jgi:tetratricopeptide (TPR) repeat protein